VAIKTLLAAVHGEKIHNEKNELLNFLNRR